MLLRLLFGRDAALNFFLITLSQPERQREPSGPAEAPIVALEFEQSCSDPLEGTTMMASSLEPCFSGAIGKQHRHSSDETRVLRDLNAEFIE